MFDYSHRKDCLLSLNDILCISGGWDYSSPSSGLGISPCWTSRVLVGPFVWPVKAPLYGSMSLCCISPSSQFFIVCKFAEGVLSPIIQVSNGKVQVWTPVSTLGCTSGLKSPVKISCEWSQTSDLYSSANFNTVLHSAYLSCSSVRMLWGTVLKVLPNSRLKTSSAFPLMLCSAVQEIVLSGAWLELLEKVMNFVK